MTELRRFTKEEQASFGHTVAELRQLAREHGIRGQNHDFFNAFLIAV